MHYRILQLVTTFNIHGLAISIMEISLESNYYLQRISYYLLKFPLNSILRLSSFITFSNQPQVIYLSYSSVTLTQFTLHTATLRFAFNYTIKYQNPRVKQLHISTMQNLQNSFTPPALTTLSRYTQHY